MLTDSLADLVCCLPYTPEELQDLLGSLSFQPWSESSLLPFWSDRVSGVCKEHGLGDLRVIGDELLKAFVLPLEGREMQVLSHATSCDPAVTCCLVTDLKTTETANSGLEPPKLWAPQGFSFCKRIRSGVLLQWRTLTDTLDLWKMVLRFPIGTAYGLPGLCGILFRSTEFRGHSECGPPLFILFFSVSVYFQPLSVSSLFSSICCRFGNMEGVWGNAEEHVSWNSRVLLAHSLSGITLFSSQHPLHLLQLFSI